MSLELSEGTAAALRSYISLPAIVVLGAARGTLWSHYLDELAELKEGPRGAVALLRDKYDDSAHIYVACAGRCPSSAAERARSMLESAGRALVASSDPTVIDALIAGGARVHESYQVALMTVSRGQLARPEKMASVEVTGLDEHHLSAAEELLYRWNERMGYSARDMVMMGSAYGAWEGDRLVAVVGTYAAGDDWWYLGGLFVDPEARGRGVGKALMYQASQEALNKAGEAYAAVEPDNATCRALLAKLGYRTVEVSASYVMSLS